MIQFVNFSKSRVCSSPSDLASLIHNVDLYNTFQKGPHCIRRRLFVCLMTSNWFGELSFSRMALIKNKLRITKTYECLSALEPRSVESYFLHNKHLVTLLTFFAN